MHDVRSSSSIGALVAGGLLALGAAGCGSPTPVGTRAPVAVRVRGTEAAASTASARYSATINPATRVDVAFKVGGYVERVARVPGDGGTPRLLQAGDQVRRGDELAVVRRSDYAQKLDEARAALAEAGAARQQADNDHQRAQRLATTQSISPADVDTARMRLEAAVARVDGARARLAAAQTALSDTTLRSPLDGVVLSRQVELGTLAGPGTVAFVVADTRSVKVVFGVPDTVLETLHQGDPQTVTLEALRGVPLAGRITRIAPAADLRSRVFEVEVTLDNPEGDLKPGMVASLQLGSAGTAAASSPGGAERVIPLSAVVRSPDHHDRYAVFVVEAGVGGEVARLREVEVGELRGNVIPVRSGLGAGDRVVVQGAALLSGGEPVQVIP